jgi:(S)-2-hydroxyglutarate dehydrogenase
MLPARDELPQLEELRKRAQANRLAGVRLIRPEHLREIEPHANGLGALLVRSTGVTEFALICEKYANIIIVNGGRVLTPAELRGSSAHPPISFSKSCALRSRQIS